MGQLLGVYSGNRAIEDRFTVLVVWENQGEYLCVRNLNRGSDPISELLKLH